MGRRGFVAWAQTLLPIGVSRTGLRLRPSLRYLFTPEVHIYATSIAANALLSLFPFTLILLTACRRWLHWEAAYRVILQLLRANLPGGADFVVLNLIWTVQGRHRLQAVSVLMLFFTSAGIFLPLETALNRVWGFTQSRGFLRNQGVSFLLAVVSGVLALCSILLTAWAQQFVMRALGWVPFYILVSAVSRLILEAVSIPTVIVIYFVIFYFLPNGKVPARQVLPAAVVAGLLTELGKFVYQLSLPLFGFREVYGPFTLSATLFFWAFVGALILLWGVHLSIQGFQVLPRADLAVQSLPVTEAVAVRVVAQADEHAAGNPEHS